MPQYHRLTLPVGQAGQRLLQRVHTGGLLHLLRRAGCRIGGFSHVIKPRRPRTATPQAVGTKVGHNAVDPSGNLGLSCAPLRRLAPQTQHRLLGHILGLGTVAQHPQRVAVNARHQPGGQQPRRCRIATGVALQQLGIRIVLLVGQILHPVHR